LGGEVTTNRGTEQVSIGERGQNQSAPIQREREEKANGIKTDLKAGHARVGERETVRALQAFISCEEEEDLEKHTNRTSSKAQTRARSDP